VRHEAGPLVDGYGRTIRKLRISLLDACNFRCFYCMPPDPVFMPWVSLLPASEIVAISRELNRLGIREMRLTGGEPTVRRDFDAIVRGLSELELDSLGLTTNGLLLDTKLDLLESSACRSINVSLDSLRPDRFAGITGMPRFGAVHANILRARDRGFRVKVNVVVCRGTNEDELVDFANFSAREGITVRFLELMRIGPRHRDFEALSVTAAEMIAALSERFRLEPVEVAADSTAFVYRTDHGAQLGFIASESRPFCGDCSRLRLSATGHLRACLMSERGLDVRGLSPEQLRRALHAVMAMKPAGRPGHVAQPMYQIGG
jgi:GTP 3',8-cyclase